MIFNKSTLYFPQKNKPINLEEITELGIAAHQDDLEIIAYPGILEGYKKKKKIFGGIVCTNGVSSPSTANKEKIKEIRRKEQENAADIGKYGFVLQLDYYSSEIKENENKAFVNNLIELIMDTKPDTIYTHNPFDKHKTHLSVFSAVINALKSIKKEFMPKNIYGCEVWRSLDWLCDEDRVEFDVSDNHGLASKLIGVFKSQIEKKNYENAVISRRKANATFSNAYKSDVSREIIIGVDLKPLVYDDESIDDFISGKLNRFCDEIKNNIKPLI